MDLKPYIDSGILELYVLDQLSVQKRRGVERMLKVYAALREEVLAIEITLENFALANAVIPSVKMRGKIVNAIKKIEQTTSLDLNGLPLIDEHADFKAWLQLAEQFKPARLVEGIFNKVLQHTDSIMQVLVVSEIGIPEEIHTDEQESFLILQGKCECVINGKSRLMGPGDYMSIPLHEPHHVLLKSKRVTAILQHQKV